MRKGGGKAKGSNFEREICKKLTIWATGQEKPYVFWRSPSSGAVATISQSSNISGDIIAVKEEGNFFTDVFSIECKDGYPDADFMKLFKNNKNDIIQGFWEQCIRDSRIAHKHGMLIFRKKGFPILVGVEDYTDIAMILKNETKYVQIGFNDTMLPDIIFFDFDVFLSKINKEMFKRNTDEL